MPRKHDKIIIIDFGSQYTHLLARRIREMGVQSLVVSPTYPLKDLVKAKGIILSGGPMSVTKKNSPRIGRRIFNYGIPILGLCYGHQLMAYLLGGSLVCGSDREYGESNIAVKGKLNNASLFSKTPKEQVVWMSHGDSVDRLPIGFNSAASSQDCKYAAMVDAPRKLYGLQFHPEVTHTDNGKKILSNFVFSVCQAQPDWQMTEIIDELIRHVRSAAGNKNVFLLVSGGVDSTVAFALLEKALGKKRVYGLHIDSGVLRMDESRSVKKSLARAGFDNLHVVAAADQFIKALYKVADPEKKRHLIGEQYLMIAEKEMKRRGLRSDKWLLGQGTIYPDTIETGGTKHAETIKTHHNRIPRIQKMISQGKIIEPLRELYKDEVRQLGTLLKIPGNLLNRHPFPGPGLAIRLLGSNSRRSLSAADIKSNQQIISYAGKLAKKIIKGTLLPIKSVGVQGDERTYAKAFVFTGLSDWQTMRSLARMIPARFKIVNRVLWLLAGPIDELKREKTTISYVDSPRLLKLRKIDQAVNSVVKKNNISDKLWQLPVILLPLGVADSVVIRPVVSHEAMTVQPFRFQKLHRELIVKAIKKHGISYIFYDLTDKPPATIEWE
ncbi:MAG: glutamine-hydrolyzing GMP synthase [Patescibacteria group bacterium]